MKIGDIEIKIVKGKTKVICKDSKICREILLEDLSNISIRIRKIKELDEEIVKEYDSWTVTKIYEKIQKLEDVRDRIGKVLKSRNYRKDNSLAPKLSMEAMELLREDVKEKEQEWR